MQTHEGALCFVTRARARRAFADATAAVLRNQAHHSSSRTSSFPTAARSSKTGESAHPTRPKPSFITIAPTSCSRTLARREINRLRAVRATADAFVFRFIDVTNRAPDQAALFERTLRFSAGMFEDTEVYRLPGGKDEATTYRFVRQAQSK